MNSSKRHLHLTKPDQESTKYTRIALDKKKVFRLMVKARAMEERMIKMVKGGESLFWIGGPGEEAFSVPLGLLLKKGQGLDYDFIHSHYRSSGTLLAMGMPMIDELRQAGSKATDPMSGGRNFCNHFSKKEWNVVPGTSPIGLQFSIAPGTALAQLRHGGDGISVVVGGDAGTAEADFATCLNWSSQPGKEVPLLMIVMNNKYGISTHFDEVHGDRIIARRAAAFGIRWDTVNGNDPVESWNKLQDIIMYVRKERKPFCLEAYCSRLYGHSSASGANFVSEEIDCVKEFQKKLIEEKVFSESECKKIREEYEKEAMEAAKIVRQEPDPDPNTIYDHIFKE